MAGTDRSLPKKQIWYFNPLIDLLCLGGITFFFILLFDLRVLVPNLLDIVLMPVKWLYSGFTFTTQAWVQALPAPVISNLAWIPITTYIGSILVNYPHYAATYYRVYRDAGEVKKYAFEAVWTPVLLAALGFASLFAANTLAPWYCMGYILFSGYHYSGQTYGISLIFAGKSGFRLNTWQKWCIIIPVYFCYIYPTVLGNTPDNQIINFFGINLPNLNLPHWVPGFALVTFYIGLVMYAVMNLHLYLTEKRRLPMIVHVVVGSQIIWYSAGSLVEGFFSFVPFFHCLQYLIITTYFDFKETVTKKPDAADTSARYLRSRHFGKYYLIQIIVGSILFILIPLIIEGAGLATLALATAVTISFLNMHHFILDGAIWKLRKPEVGQALFS